MIAAIDIVHCEFQFVCAEDPAPHAHDLVHCVSARNIQCVNTLSCFSVVKCHLASRISNL
jgi:hypothetical protein